MEKSYGADYYNHYDIGSKTVKYLECAELRKFHANVARELTEHFHPQTVLDAGCAMGILVSEFSKQGVQAYGLDFSQYAVDNADPLIRSNCYCGSLAEPFPEGLPKHFDFVTCMEVLEHMSPEDGRKAVANICKVTDTVLFCSTPDDFEDRTHINVQQREYWAALFAENGFYDDLSYRPLFMTEYAVCYRRVNNLKIPVQCYEKHIRTTDTLLKNIRDAEYSELEDAHKKAVFEWTQTGNQLSQLKQDYQSLQSDYLDQIKRVADLTQRHDIALQKQAHDLEKAASSMAIVAQQLRQANEDNVILQDACKDKQEKLEEISIKYTKLLEDHESIMSDLAYTEQLEWDLEQSRAKHDAEHRAYTELKAEFDKTMKIYNDTYICLNQASAEVTELKSSRSWKITAPVRWMTLHARHLIGRSARKLYHGAKRVQNYIYRHRGGDNEKQWPPVVHVLPSGEADSVGPDCRRIGIYSIYDKDGVVDDYIIYYLQQLLKHVERLIVVSNGPLQDEGKTALEKIGCQIIIRENRGFDAWGIKCGIESVGFESLSAYDEVVISNNTLFGPIYDMSIMFSEMAGRKLDFWGVSSHSGWQNMDPFGTNPYGYIPEHVQTFFYVVRNRMLREEAFRKFWTELPELPDYSSAVGKYETAMTKYYTDLGYVSATYMDPADYYELTEYPLITMPAESMRDLKCPFFKRKAFFQDYDYLSACTGFQTASYLLQYLKECTDYPVDWVWKNLIRTCHMSDLVQDLHLAKIFDRDDYFMPEKPSSLKAALFMHIYDESMSGELKRYASSMSETADIFISTTSEEKKASISAAFAELPNRIEIRVLPNRGRDVSALLTSFRDVVMNYDVACVTHDKKTGYLKPQTVGEGFAYMGYENILASRAFTEQILSAFEEEPFLGLLYAPDPNHADFATHIGLEWGENFDATKNLAEELNLHVPMDETHPPMAPFGSSFWFRTKAMKPLFAKNWTHDDFPREPLDLKDGSILHAIERIYPYVAQEAGYYSAMVDTADYAALDLGNLSYYAQQYTEGCFESGIASRFITVRDLCNARISGTAPAPAVAEEPEVEGGKLRKILIKWADCH